jgi:TPR repeat protein
VRGVGAAKVRLVTSSQEVLSGLDGYDIIAWVRAAAAADPVDADELVALCEEVHLRILRAEVMLGLLPYDAPAVRAEGFAAAAAAGHRGAALRYAGLSRTLSTEDKEAARRYLAPHLASDPDGTAHYWYGVLQYLLGNAGAAAITQHRAADQGNAEALFELHIFYATGQGVVADEAIAHDYLVRAAALDQPRALYNVAAGYATGNGFPLDKPRAAGCYERAAEAGNARAAATLGVMHLIGDGIPEDPALAARWLDHAERDGYDVDDLLAQLALSRPVATG